jgi:Fe2+ or Zn2+ uptake regulation protein
VPKPKNTKLSVFKGREVRLNRAIFHILALEDPLTIYDIYKEVIDERGLNHVRYASVNKRVRALEDSGYIKKACVKRTKASFEANMHEPTTRAHLVILLNSTNLEDLINELDEDDALMVLAAILNNI